MEERRITPRRRRAIIAPCLRNKRQTESLAGKEKEKEKEKGKGKEKKKRRKREGKEELACWDDEKEEKEKEKSLQHEVFPGGHPSKY